MVSATVRFRNKIHSRFINMWKLIIYNVYKHKFVFYLIGATVLLSSFYLVIGLNTVFSVNRSLIDAVADNMTGDVIIVPREVNRIDIITKDGEKKLINLPRHEELLKYLNGLDYVLAAAPRLRIRGVVRSEDNILPMVIHGIDPEAEKKLLPNRTLESGRWLEKNGEMMLYYRHSDRLSVKLGDKLGINVETLDGYTNFDVADLVGIVDYKDVNFYSEVAFMGYISLDFLNQLLTSDENYVGDIYIRLKKGESVGRLQNDIHSKFGDLYNYVEPQDSAYLIQGIYRLTGFSIYFIAFLLLFMVYLSSSLLVNLSIETRRQEIGIYMALGVPVWRIGILFGGELFIVMIIFGILGTSLAISAMNTLFSSGIEAVIIPLQLIFGRYEVFIVNHMETYISVIALLAIVLLGTTVSAIYKLSKQSPVEIMRDL